MEGKNFWIVSVPKSQTEDVFGQLNRHTRGDSGSKDLSIENYRLNIPDDLRVGTLDDLMSLTEELGKTDYLLESTLKKIGRQYTDLTVDPESKEKKEIPIGDTNPVTYLTHFKWEDARYPRRKQLTELVAQMKKDVLKLDGELRSLVGEYNQLNQTINAILKKKTGTLMVRNLSEIVQKEDIVETDYLTTLLVVVGRSDIREWLSTYETLTEFVLPRSSKCLKEEDDYSLYTVILFKRIAEDFKNLAREKKFTVRKNTGGSVSTEEEKKLTADRDKKKRSLTRWCLTNFGDAFASWIHLKCIRTFVESVLRYGLPANFQAMLLHPNKKKVKKLRETLQRLYASLGGDDDIGELDPTQLTIIGSSGKFYPYVWLDVKLDLWAQE